MCHTVSADVNSLLMNGWNLIIYNKMCFEAAITYHPSDGTDSTDLDVCGCMMALAKPTGEIDKIFPVIINPPVSKLPPDVLQILLCSWFNKGIKSGLVSQEDISKLCKPALHLSE